MSVVGLGMAMTIVTLVACGLGVSCGMVMAIVTVVACGIIMASGTAVDGRVGHVEGPCQGAAC